MNREEMTGTPARDDASGQYLLKAGVSLRDKDNKCSGRINSDDLTTVTINVDVRESLERVESVIEQELPRMHEEMCEAIGESFRGPIYKGVKQIAGCGMELTFVFYCKGQHYQTLSAMLNRGLKLMCEQNDIAIAAPQITVNGTR